MRIAPLEEHLARFREAIYSIEEYVPEDQVFDGASKLLQYAGGIQGIHYSAASDAGMYCSGIADFERKQEASVEPFLKAQAVFSLVWMALESLIDDLEPAGPQSIGKIGRLCLYLKTESADVVVPEGYDNFVQRWVALEQSFESEYRRKDSFPDHVDLTGEGVFRVYCLRNHLFHGDFSGFDPKDRRWDVYTEALELGTRIVALTIQMALMVYFCDSTMDTYWARSLSFDNDEVSVSEGFSKMHLEDA